MELSKTTREEGLSELDALETVCAGSLTGKRILERSDGAEHKGGVVARAAVVGVARTRSKGNSRCRAQAQACTLCEDTVQWCTVVAEGGNSEPVRERDVVKIDRVVRELRAQNRRIVQVQHHPTRPCCHRCTFSLLLLFLLLLLLSSFRHLLVKTHVKNKKKLKLKEERKKICSEIRTASVLLWV